MARRFWQEGGCFSLLLKMQDDLTNNCFIFLLLVCFFFASFEDFKNHQ